jgi:hypothetical protein
MSLENKPMIVPLHFGQVIMLLTCWLKIATFLQLGIHKKMFETHNAKDMLRKRTVFNIVSLSSATTQDELKVLVVTYLINSETKKKDLNAFVYHWM